MGTSLFAPEVFDLAEDTGLFDVIGFIENWDRNKTKGTFLEKPVVWFEEAKPWAETSQAICSLGTTRRHLFIEEARRMGFNFAKILHPTARISKTSHVGEGSILSVGVIVASHSQIGCHVIVNRGCMIGHHTNIHDYVTVSPGSNIAGAVTIGEGAYIGMGSIVLDKIQIGAHSIVAAGSVVTRDVPPHVQVMGAPAKIVKENVEGR